MAKPIVVKVGGHELDDPAFVEQFAATIAGLKRPVVVVHGGGKEISTLQQKMGIEPRYVDGVRVTDAESLAIVEMVLCGLVNKRLVHALVGAGVDALGLSGVDRGIVRAEKMAHATIDMGFTGRPVSVRGDALLDLIGQGITPVLAPICLGPDSDYNVNADHVAGAVAPAIGAERVVFLTNVRGVLINGNLTPVLTPEKVEALIADGTIFGGMIPKVRTALEALHGGVPQAMITNLDGLKAESGTIFQREQTIVE